MPGPPELPCACRSLHAARRPAMYSPLLSARQWCLRPGLQFFFSGGRRHTRSLRDWSSDVCSSDLAASSVWTLMSMRLSADSVARRMSSDDIVNVRYATESSVYDVPVPPATPAPAPNADNPTAARSEERRVGKEWRAPWAPRQHTKS